jgi:cyclophilin family peptidyl-prolyl cis-trans isomerase
VPCSRRTTRRALLAALALGALASPGCARREEIAEIQVPGQGTIRFRFFPDEAPRTVENFKKLAREGFYDGTTFHRVSPGFMIQGGDPNSKDADPGNDGLGGPGYELPAEPSELHHTEGTVSMAQGERSGSSGSQFFIVLRDRDDNKQLDGQYTIFGQVVGGLDVARKIAWLPSDEHKRPFQPAVMASVRIEQARLPR